MVAPCRALNAVYLVIFLTTSYVIVHLLRNGYVVNNNNINKLIIRAINLPLILLLKISVFLTPFLNEILSPHLQELQQRTELNEKNINLFFLYNITL